MEDRFDIHPHDKQTQVAKIIHIASSIIYIICGILVMSIKKFQDLEDVASIMIAIATIIIGAASIFGYFSNDMYRLAFQSDFALGIFDVVLGILMIIKQNDSIITLCWFAGILSLLDGGNKAQVSVDGYRFGISKWYIVTIAGVLEIAAAVIALTFSAINDINLLIAVGVAMIVMGVANVWTTMYTVRVKKNKKERKKQSKELIEGEQNGED